MQKNTKNYTFLLSHSTKSKIYIRRFEVSRKLLHSGLAAFILTFGLISLGVVGLIKTDALAKTKDASTAETALAAPRSRSQAEEPKSIDYSRPSGAENFAINAGGPVSELQMTEAEAQAANGNDVQEQILFLKTTVSPANLPTMWAHLGKINNEFGFRRNPFGGRSYEFHAGMDIDGERGDGVIAPANGTIVKAGWQGGYGNMIEIDHGNDIVTRYAHASRLHVKLGDIVKRNQHIANIGSTGRSTGPHLHFEVRVKGVAQDPQKFLSAGAEQRGKKKVSFR